VPYELFRQKSEGAGSSSDEDPDFKDNNKMVVNEHFEFCFPTTPTTTLLEIKKLVIQKAGKIGARQIKLEHLELCACKYGEVYEQFEDSTLVESIDTGCKLYMIET